MKNRFYFILTAILINSTAYTQELLSLKKLKEMPVYILNMDTLRCGNNQILGYEYQYLDDASILKKIKKEPSLHRATQFIDEYTSEKIWLKNISKKSYPEIYRLVLAINSRCYNRVDFSKFPNLQELCLIDYCPGIDTNDAKHLQNVQILKIMDNEEVSGCFTDSLQKYEKYFVPRINEGMYLLTNLVEFSINSARMGNNYIHESFWDLKKLQKVVVEYGSLIPIGLLTHKKILKKSSFTYSNHHSYNDYIFTYLSTKKYIHTHNALQKHPEMKMKENGLYEAYYDDDFYSDYFRLKAADSIYLNNEKHKDDFEWQQRKYQFNDSLFTNFKNYSDDTLYRQKMLCHGEFKDGKLDGQWIFYYPDGKIAEERYYENGIETGTWICYSTVEYTNLQNSIKGDYIFKLDFLQGNAVKLQRSWDSQ